MTAKQVKFQRAAASGTDRRITIINEFVQGIRVVKYYAWERPFLGVLDKARDDELVWLRKYNVLKSVSEHATRSHHIARPVSYIWCLQPSLTSVRLLVHSVVV